MDLVLSIVMLAAAGMFAGAAWLWRKQGPVKQVWLMLLLGFVMLVNVAIWTIPTSDGTAPIDQVDGDRAVRE